MARWSVALLILAALAPAARAADDEKPPSLYANGTWDRAQYSAAKAPLVIVGKVVEAGKAEGPAWTQNKPENYDQSTMSFLISLRQSLKVEVKEIIQGEIKDDKLTVRVEEVGLPAGIVQQMQMRPQAKNPVPRYRAEIPAADFALAKDATYLFFLSAPKSKKDKDGEETLIADHLAKGMPMAAPDEQLLKSARAFCRAMADWKTPPKFSDEEAARVKALVADLANDEFEKRDKAEADLKNMGASIRPYIEAAAKDADPERAERARVILKAIEPAPGKVELPKRAAAGALPPAPVGPEPAPVPAPRSSHE